MKNVSTEKKIELKIDQLFKRVDNISEMCDHLLSSEEYSGVNQAWKKLSTSI